MSDALHDSNAVLLVMTGHWLCCTRNTEEETSGMNVISAGRHWPRSLSSSLWAIGRSRFVRAIVTGSGPVLVSLGKPPCCLSENLSVIVMFSQPRGTYTPRSPLASFVRA